MNAIWLIRDTNLGGRRGVRLGCATCLPAFSSRCFASPSAESRFSLPVHERCGQWSETLGPVPCGCASHLAVSADTPIRLDRMETNASGYWNEKGPA
jgi:hypothetical protein